MGNIESTCCSNVPFCQKQGNGILDPNTNLNVAAVPGKQQPENQPNSDTVVIQSSDNSAIIETNNINHEQLNSNKNRKQNQPEDVFNVAAAVPPQSNRV